MTFGIPTHPVAAGHDLVYRGVHSSQANSALGLLLDSCGCSCPFRLQARDNRREWRSGKADQWRKDSKRQFQMMCVLFLLKWLGMGINPLLLLPKSLLILFTDPIFYWFQWIFWVFSVNNIHLFLSLWTLITTDKCSVVVPTSPGESVV